MVLLFSSAHYCLAPSICLKLFRHEFIAEVVRARMKLGITTAPRTQTTALTTIRILAFRDITCSKESVLCVKADPQPLQNQSRSRTIDSKVQTRSAMTASAVNPAAFHQNFLSSDCTTGIARQKHDHAGDFLRLNHLGNGL